MIVKLNKMVEEGMAERSWADSIIKKKFEEPIASEDFKDPFLRSETPILSNRMFFSLKDCPVMWIRPKLGSFERYL
jgi:hypothetical protein